MPRATWKGVVIAEASDDAVEIVEGNVYFPLNAVQTQYLRPSQTQTVCPWKGTASYYHVAVEGETSADAAWYYATPSAAAAEIEGRVAFWKDVRVER